MPNKIKAVFFDAGGTLFCPHPSVGEIYAGTARRYGKKYEPKTLEAEFHAAWKRRRGLTSLGAETSHAKERNWWYTLVREVFSTSGGPPEEYDAFFDELHQSFVRKELWRIYPEVHDVLGTLKVRDFVIGVISNWDLRLSIVLSNLGLKEYFDFVIGSSAFGVTKPSEKIFEEALRRAGVQPEEAIHVGDNFDEDFIGAQRAGIKPIHIDRDGVVETRAGDARIKSLDQIFERLR